MKTLLIVVCGLCVGCESFSQNQLAEMIGGKIGEYDFSLGVKTFRTPEGRIGYSGPAIATPKNTTWNYGYK